MTTPDDLRRLDRHTLSVLEMLGKNLEKADHQLRLARLRHQALMAWATDSRVDTAAKEA